MDDIQGFDLSHEAGDASDLSPNLEWPSYPVDLNGEPVDQPDIDRPAFVPID